jgi:phosphohistidine phosphatase
MAPAASRRTVWLLRHAKTVADPPPGGSDFDRVLAPRGRRDAKALGRLFAGNGDGLGRSLSKTPPPAVALVSPAARTRATAELVVAGMADPPEQRYEHDLYGADPEDVVNALKRLPHDVSAAMVVGHNPTAHDLSRALLSPRDEKGMELAMRRGFPTCALGVYTFKTSSWKDVDFGGATLVALMVPPYT